MDNQTNLVEDIQDMAAPSAAPDRQPNGTHHPQSYEDDELLRIEELLNDPAHAYPDFQYGDTIDGLIMQIDKEGITVDIGAKSEGVVPPREMQSLTNDDKAGLHVGDQLLVFVVQPEHRDGYTVLSVDKARQARSWRRLEQAHENSEVIEARVVNYNKGGVLVSLDGVRGFVPSSQVDGISRGNDTQKQSDMARLVGRDLQLKVIEINRDRNRLILSERQALQEVRESRKDELLATLQEGETYPGKVSSVCDFGAFVDIGGTDGLIHLSELSWGRVKHPSEVLSVGQDIQVYLLNIDHERKRIALSYKRTQPEPWETVGERYQLGQLVSGIVTQLAPFGAFARIEDGIEGLIHISEMGDGHIQHPRDVVKEGEEVQVRIIRIDPTRKRMGLSLRTQSSDEPSAEQPDSNDAAPAEGAVEAAATADNTGAEPTDG